MASLEHLLYLLLFLSVSNSSIFSENIPKNTNILQQQVQNGSFIESNNTGYRLQMIKSMLHKAERRDTSHDIGSSMRYHVNGTTTNVDENLQPQNTINGQDHARETFTAPLSSEPLNHQSATLSSVSGSLLHTALPISTLIGQKSLQNSILQDKLSDLKQMTVNLPQEEQKSIVAQHIGNNFEQNVQTIKPELQRNVGNNNSGSRIQMLRRMLNNAEYKGSSHNIGTLVSNQNNVTTTTLNTNPENQSIIRGQVQQSETSIMPLSSQQLSNQSATPSLYRSSLPHTTLRTPNPTGQKSVQNSIISNPQHKLTPQTTDLKKNTMDIPQEEQKLNNGYSEQQKGTFIQPVSSQQLLRYQTMIPPSSSPSSSTVSSSQLKSLSTATYFEQNSMQNSIIPTQTEKFPVEVRDFKQVSFSTSQPTALPISGSSCQQNSILPPDFLVAHQNVLQNIKTDKLGPMLQNMNSIQSIKYEAAPKLMNSILNKPPSEAISSQIPSPPLLDMEPNLNNKDQLVTNIPHMGQKIFISETHPQEYHVGPLSTYQTSTDIQNNQHYSSSSPSLATGTLQRTALPTLEAYQPASLVQQQQQLTNQLDLLQTLRPLPVLSQEKPGETCIVLPSLQILPDNSYQYTQLPNEYSPSQFSIAQEFNPMSQIVQLNNLDSVSPCTNNVASKLNPEIVPQNMIISDESLQGLLNLLITLPPPNIPASQIAILSPSPERNINVPSPVTCSSSNQTAQSNSCYLTPQTITNNPIPIDHLPPVNVDVRSDNKGNDFDDLLPILFLSMLSNRGNGYPQYRGNCGRCECCRFNNCGSLNRCNCPYNCGCPGFPPLPPLPPYPPLPFYVPEDSSESEESDELDSR